MRQQERKTGFALGVVILMYIKMIELSIQFLQQHILPLGALGVFLASVAEEVFAPIPSAIIMTTSGFIFVPEGISFISLSKLIFVVALPAALGVTLGSYTIYFIARFGGRLVIERFGKYVGLYLSDIEKLEAKMSGTRRDEYIIALARVTPFVPSVAISAFCGIIEMNVFKYFYITLVGTFVRGLILGGIGWQVGNVYEKYAAIIQGLEKWILLSTILGIVAFVVLKYVKRDK